jgi:hypothetical protein
MGENQEHQDAQPEGPEETLENEQPAQREQPKYRSHYHKKGGQLPPVSSQPMLISPEAILKRRI